MSKQRRGKSDARRQAKLDVELEEEGLVAIEQQDKVSLKVRLGPNLILSGPIRSATSTEVPKQNAGSSSEPEIPYGQDTDIDIKREEAEHPLYAPEEMGGSTEMVDLEKQLKQAKENLHRAEQRISHLEAALEERNGELDATVSFAGVARSFSGADIIDLANAFNLEVFQSAAYIAESLNPMRRWSRRLRQKVAAGAREPAFDQAKLSLGMDLLQELIKEGENDSGKFLLQVSLQVCMVTFGANVLQSWSSDLIEHRVTDEIYQRITRKETQSIAGSWRAVTRRSQESRDQNDKTDALLGTIIDILIVAGCWDRGYDSDARLSEFFKKFQENITRVVGSSLKLRDAIGGVTRIDIVPTTIPSGSHFCPEVMGDSYASNDRHTEVSDSDYTLGTTELGLLERNSGDASAHQALLLKPKIVLHSALNSSFLGREPTP
ncbi:hypothetical protein DXG01_015639 [Tephrocybe rancida]|nr:hypothetical protein DXG01_015639 [Tephrocybe rancida]